ncbi:MAG: regulatory iron-sulfur-containing complex subunit RicT [Bacilli bacterium]|nr:regulatory iron-sulfur-containing complex subunit RicT [Bacilli bacterium]
MIKAVGILFENDEKTYYALIPQNQVDLKVTKNSFFVVEKEKCVYFGKAVTEIIEKDEKEVSYKVIRPADEKDLQNHKKNIKDANSALNDAIELSKKYSLNMQIIDAIFTFDRDQLLFHFYAEDRIDFRLLAKSLASIYKTRIELRQIGVRDKAKKIGGHGICGQKLCCARFLKDFESVSISMAKNQNISLNQNKINGVCGRLLCCLKYENDYYKECKQCLPNLGDFVILEEGQGKVIDVDILNKKYKVDIPNIGIIEVTGCNGSN